MYGYNAFCLKEIILMEFFYHSNSQLTAHLSLVAKATPSLRLLKERFLITVIRRYSKCNVTVLLSIKMQPNPTTTTYPYHD
jgi:hypothetical protein